MLSSMSDLMQSLKYCIYDYHKNQIQFKSLEADGSEVLVIHLLDANDETWDPTQMKRSWVKGSELMQPM